MEDLVAGSPVTVQRLFEISWVTVERITGRVVGETSDPGRLESLSFIVVDEQRPVT